MTLHTFSDSKACVGSIYHTTWCNPLSKEIDSLCDAPLGGDVNDYIRSKVSNLNPPLLFSLAEKCIIEIGSQTQSQLGATVPVSAFIVMQVNMNNSEETVGNLCFA